MKRSSTRGLRSVRIISICIALSASALAACGSSDDDPSNPVLNVRPTFLGTVTTATYDGTSDDLLTAGSGLGWAAKRNRACGVGNADGERVAPARDLQQLSCAGRYHHRRRLRRDLWPECSGRGRCAERGARRGQDCRHRISGL